ncbi:MAG: PEP-utilizing enzyme [Patescibacteria group bacterium]
MKLKVNLKKPLDQWGPIDARILYPSFWLLPLSALVAKTYGVLWPEMMGIFQRERMTFIWEKRKMQNRAEIAIEKWLLNEKKFLDLKKEYRHLVKTGDELEIKIKKTLSKKNLFPDELSKIAKLVYDQLINFWTSTFVFELANFGSPEYLKKQLSGYLPKKKIDLALEILLAPEALSFHQQSELELLKLYVKSNSKKDLGKKLKKFAAKWYWVNDSFRSGFFLNGKDFLKELKNLNKPEAKKKIFEIKILPDNVLAKKMQFIKSSELPKKFLHIVRRLSFSIWWQDNRKTKIWQYNGLVRMINKVSSEKFNIPLSQLELYTAEEWLDLHKKGIKISPNILKIRDKFCVFEIGNGNFELLTGNKLQKIIQRAVNSGKPGNKDIIQGTVVSKGGKAITRGKVKVILSPHQGSGFKKGGILVAPMTSPDFVPLMRKAAAIITDVGGLMSHAAIISRELNIPCIVGTKIATQVLKDGDLVEVDAERGVVRLIKK